jgi:hypothetical protein
VPPKGIFGSHTNITAEPFAAIGESHSYYPVMVARLTQPAQSSLVSQLSSSSAPELGTVATGSGCCSSCRWADFVRLLAEMFGSATRAFGSGGPEFVIDIIIAPSDWPMIKREFDCHSILCRRIQLLALPITFALASFISYFHPGVGDLAPSESWWFAFTPSWGQLEELLSSC